MAQSFSPYEVRSYYAARLPALRMSNGPEWRGPCPIHNGKDHNFAVNSTTGLWMCFSQCARGGDIITLERELSGTDFTTARETVYTIIGRESLRAPKASRGPKERRRFAQCRALAETLGICARRWHRATVAAMYSEKANQSELSLAWKAHSQALFSLESMNPREIILAYLKAAREDPEETRRRLAWAEAEERDCAHLAAFAVRMIAESQKAPNAA
jgi:DNA primase